MELIELGEVVITQTTTKDLHLEITRAVVLVEEMDSSSNNSRIVDFKTIKLVRMPWLIRAIVVLVEMREEIY